MTKLLIQLIFISLLVIASLFLMIFSANKLFLPIAAHAAAPATQCAGGAVYACVASAVMARKANKHTVEKQYLDTS
jgi:hypothetical protein